jgi:hypothetical protein
MIAYDPNAENGDEKFKELIVYIAQQTEFDPKCGATKLNKILFFCDFLAYRELGKAITGKVYQKLENGPAPKALVPVRNELAENGDIEYYKSVYHHDQNRIRAKRSPNLDIFSGSEVALIDRVIKKLEEDDGVTVSRKSHKFVPCWEEFELNEKIPYGVSLVKKNPPVEEGDQEFAKSFMPFLKDYIANSEGK